MGGSIVYTRIRLLLLISFFISSFFFLSNFQTLEFLSHFSQELWILESGNLVHTWASSRENVSSNIFDQVWLKPACPATEASYNLETLDIASIHIILSKQRTTKVLIRLRGCAGWSAPLLFVYGIRHIFAWPGPHEQRIDVSWIPPSSCCCCLFIHFLIFFSLQFSKIKNFLQTFLRNCEA